MSLFFYFFKTLVGKEIVVELKNNLAIRGTLHSVDQASPCPVLLCLHVARASMCVARCATPRETVAGGVAIADAW